MTSENWAYQASVKYGPNMQSMLNVRARTADEFKELLRELPVEDLLNAGAVVLGGSVAQDALGGTFVPEGAIPQQPTYAQVPAAPVAPAATSAPPAGLSPSCHHGTKIWREAKPGSGKTWKGWFCPSPQGTPDQCKAEFVNGR